MDKEFDWEAAQKAIAAYLEAERLYKQAIEEHEMLEQSQPTKPVKIEEPGEWEHYTEKHYCWQSEYQAAKQESKEAQERYNEALTALRRAIPRNVWIRYGNQGVGLCYDNWGGSHPVVVVKQWGQIQGRLQDRIHYD